MEFTKHRPFYDDHPFDWVEHYLPAELRVVIEPVLLDLIDTLPPSALALDVGCGAGRVIAYLTLRGILCIGFDISRISVERAVKRYGKPCAVADNLCLPVRDKVADLVISDGVIHHTSDPYRAFGESCRVLKSGGLMYLAIYKPGGRYEYLYKYPGRVIRWALKQRFTRLSVNLFAFLPYYLVHLVRSGGKRSLNGVQNLFYDYFASPVVSFISREAIERWCRDFGLDLLQYSSNPTSNVHSFVLRRSR